MTLPLWLTTWLLSAPLIAMHIVVMALASVAVGARLREVRVFLGPGATLRREEPRIVVGSIPLAGYVLCHGATADDTSDVQPRFDALPRWRRAVVLLSGNVALLVVAAVTLGPTEAIETALRTYAQLAWLVTSSDRVVEAIRAFATEPAFPTQLGIVAAKLAVLNLLPLPQLNGGQLLRLLSRAPHGRLDAVATSFGGLASLVALVTFVIAWARA